MCDLGTKVGHGLRDTASPLRAWASPASVPRLLLPCTHGFLEGKVSPEASGPGSSSIRPSDPNYRCRTSSVWTGQEDEARSHRVRRGEAGALESWGHIHFCILSGPLTHHNHHGRILAK